MLVPPSSQLQPESSPASTVHPPRKWLPLARVAWVVCALLLLVNFVVSIPAYYRLLLTVCTLPNQAPCTLPGQATTSSGQLTPGNVQALAHLHLSVSTYAAYSVSVTVVASLLFWGVGLLIFWRKSDEGMGLFASLLLVLFGATGATGRLSGTYVPAEPPLLLQILLALIVAVQWAALVAFALTFPTGRFVPRWSWLLISLNFLLDVPLVLPPILTAAGLLLSFGSTLVIMVYRYVRVFDAVQRQQTKWVVYAAALGIPLAIIGTGLPGLVPADSPYQLLNTTTSGLSIALIPFGVGIAILRYRLWDIDAIINRTLVYGSLTVLLVLLYVGLIVALQALFRGMFNQNNDVVIVVSTLIIAALIQPLRRRLQAIIDRRFYRRKYDAARTLAVFSATLRNEVDLNQLQQQLLAVVQETMQPTVVSLWVRSTEHERKHQASWSVTPPGSSEGR